MNTHRLTFAQHLGVLAGYTILSVLLTWPLVTGFSTALVGGSAHLSFNFEDASMNVWNMWWVQYALQHGHNPFVSHWLYHPEGVQLYFQTFTITGALISLPITVTFGPIAGYNAAVLLAFVLTGYFGFLLTRAYVPHTLIAFVCGALFTAGPFHLMKLHDNQLNLISIQWLPLYLLALLHFERNPGWKPILWLTLAFVLVTLTDWYWMLTCAIFTACWCAFGLLQSDQRRRLLRRYALFGAGVCVSLAPLIAGIVAVRDQLPLNDANAVEYASITSAASLDVFGLLFPAMLNPLWDYPVQQILSGGVWKTNPVWWYVAAGWVLLGCATLGVWVEGRHHKRLLAATACVWLLSLGMTLHIGGYDTGIPMPYSLIGQLPLLNSARRPSHLAVMCILAAMVFAGLGLNYLRTRFEPRTFMTIISGVSILALIECWPPQRTVFTFAQSTIFERIRAMPGVVVDLPYEWEETGRSIRHQTLHEQPILGGYVSRRPVYDQLFYSPLLSRIIDMQRRNDIVDLSTDALQTMQCYYRLRHIVAHKPELTKTQQHELQNVVQSLTGSAIQPTFEDTTYVWYTLPTFPDQCKPFAFVGNGWYDLEQSGPRLWRWAGATSDIWLINPHERPVTVGLTINGVGLTEGQSMELWNESRRPATFTVSATSRTYRFTMTLKPGANRLLLRGATVNDQAARREVSMSVTRIAVEPLQ